MLFEKRWATVPTQLLTVDGTISGVLTVADSRQCRVKQRIFLKSNTQTVQLLQINRITSKTQIEVGYIGEDIYKRADVSAFLVADSASFFAEEQVRPKIGQEDFWRAVYAEEPAVAMRTLGVDELGNPWSDINPLPATMSFIRNGIGQVVTEDTADPTNNHPLPVKLTGVQGDVIIEPTNLNLLVQLEGEYSAVDNPKPDSVGVIAHERGESQDRTKQTRRTTAKRGTNDTDTVSLDIAIHDHAGNQFTEANPVPVSDADTHAKLDTIDTDLNDFATQNHSDLDTIDADLDLIDADLNSFATQNHTDLIQVDDDIKVVQGATGAVVPAKAEYVAGKDPAGNLQGIRTSELGSTSVDGVYDAANNTDPSNVGTVMQERNAAASDSRQTQRQTAKRGSTDTDTVSADVSLHDHAGNQFTETNQFPTNSSIRDGVDPTKKATVDSDLNLHIENHGNKPDGSDVVQKLSELGETAIDGTYDGTNNTNPANVGIVAQDRNVTAADSRQIQKPTAKRGITDTSDVSIDVSLHDKNGDGLSSSNSGSKRRLDESVDGVYASPDNTDPSNMGLIVHQRATTPADTDQIKRVTGITGTVDTTHHSQDVALHDQNGNGIDSTKAGTKRRLNVDNDGIYDGTNNTDPANMGLIAHQRAASPADTDQVKRVTAVTGSNDTTHHSQDVSIHDKNGDGLTSTNSGAKRRLDESLDGVYSSPDNTDPSNMGLVVHQRTASPADTDQVKRVTGTTGTTDTTHHSQDVALHDQNGDGIDSTKAGTKRRLNVDNDGVYDGTNNTDPSNTGVVLQTRNASAADSRQIERQTAKRGTVDTTDVSADVSMHDNNGNGITSQLNGSQRAVDVGINVAGVQVDPRKVGIAETTAPTAKTTGDVTQITTDEYGRNGQVPPESLNAQWGQMFHASSNTAVLTGTTETPFLYFQNPNASGKTAKIFKISLGPTLGNNYVTYRIYLDPTITANGTGITEVGNRQTGQASNVVNVFTVPTASANGSLMKTLVLSGLSGLSMDILYNFSLWIEANHSILITRQISANATIGGVNVEWAEQ